MAPVLVAQVLDFHNSHRLTIFSFLFLLTSTEYKQQCTFNMPRGKAWTKAETITLVEAFVHIPEDKIFGVNQ